MRQSNAGYPYPSFAAAFFSTDQSKKLPVIIHDERYIVQELRNIDKLEKDLELIARYLKEGGEFTKPILDKIEKVHYDLDISIHDFNSAVESEYGMA